MGIYDRDYERGGSWNQGGRPYGKNEMSVNAKLLITIGVVFLCQMITDQRFTSLLVLYSNWYLEPWRIYGFLSYGFAHDERSISHILFNGIALFFFGQAIEARYGAREYLLIFLAGVIFSGIAWDIGEIASGGGQATMLGASGAISTIVILFALNYPHRQVLIWGVLPMPAWALAILFIGQDVLGAVNRSGNVAYTAHLGGALFGFLYFRNRWNLSQLMPSNWSKLLSFKSKPNLKVHRGSDSEEPTDADAKKLDVILKKINEQGMDSLSRSEKNFLEKESRKRKK